MAELVHQVPASAGMRCAGDHVVFSNILPVTKNQKKNEGDHLGAIKKFSEISFTLPKKVNNTKEGIPGIFSRLWTSVFFDLGSDVASMLWTSAVQVEQMNKKVGLRV